MTDVTNKTTAFAPRPASLHAVGELVSGGHDYAFAMKEFIDCLIGLAAASQEAGAPDKVPAEVFSDEPPHLESPVHRAHLAGMAETLARMAGGEPPAWCHDSKYFLREPVFFGGRHSRHLVLAGTPSAFRRRMLFCGPVLSKLHALTARE